MTVFGLRDVQLAILSPDGTITRLPYTHPPNPLRAVYPARNPKRLLWARNLQACARRGR
jgi:hypothetical protein